jgi:hypothetical protein
MKEEDEARLAKAAMKSLLVAAPQSLKDDLKRLARNRKPAPSIWDALREALSGGAWAYGAGAAFAAAAIGVFILRAVPQREPASAIAQKPAPRLEAVAPQALADLWSDDDGEDNDEI